MVDGKSQILGDNTDGIGLLRDMIANLGWTLSGSRVLILGAGGAVSGVLGPFLVEDPECLLVVNRTSEKAMQLVDRFVHLGSLEGGGYELLAGRQFDIIINGTSASLADQLPPLDGNLLSDQSYCYDLMYGSKPTVFMQWALENSALAVADGLGMLVEQAAESFYLWRNIRPKTRLVIDMLRDNF